MGRKSFITLEIRDLVGKEEVFSSPEELGRASIHRFAVAVADPNPLYYDAEFAENTRYGGIIAPPTMIFEMNHNIGDEILEDGGYASRIMLPSPLTRFVRGDNEYDIVQPARPDDKITMKREIVEIYEKEGKAGTLVFVIIEMKFFNQKEELLGINRETLIFMPAKKS
ncbi:MaoC family dehydratase N-terminal domain-containing protein [Chloroflexota bacterium]